MYIYIRMIEAVVIIVILVLLFIWSISEHFDTYFNHDMRAHTVYQKDNPDITIEESRLKDQYFWSLKNSAGENVYDKVYNDLVLEKNSGYVRKHDYQETPYDSKFNIVPNGQGYDWKKMSEDVENRTYYHPGLKQHSDSLLQPGYTIFLDQKGQH